MSIPSLHKQINEISIKRSVNIHCNSYSFQICWFQFFHLIPVFFPCVHLESTHLSTANNSRTGRNSGFYWFHSPGTNRLLWVLALLLHCSPLPSDCCCWAIIVTHLSPTKEAQGKERGCPDLLNVPYSSSLAYPSLLSSCTCPCPPRLSSALPSTWPRPVSFAGAFADCSPCSSALVCPPSQSQGCSW